MRRRNKAQEEADRITKSRTMVDNLKRESIEEGRFRGIHTKKI